MARSKCAFGAAAATLRIVDDMPFADKEAVLEEFAEMLLSPARNLKPEMETVFTAIDMGTEEVIKRTRGIRAAEDAGKPWYAKTGLEIVGPDGKPMHKYVYNQFAQVAADARITGQVRKWASTWDEGAIGANEMLNQRAISSLALRMRLKNTWLRKLGIPLVTIKAAAKGAAHASHLAFGDILGVLVSKGEWESIAAASFSNSDPIKNVPFQNVSEAARVIIEHIELGKEMTPDALNELREQVVTALTKASGDAKDPAVKKMQAENIKWLESTAGAKTVNDLADALLSRSVVEGLNEENKRQLILHLAHSRGDGFAMTEQVFNTIMESPFVGKRLTGLSSLLFEDGLQTIFGKDFKNLTSLDGSTLAFAENFLAKVMNKLSPESLAELTEHAEMVRTTRKARLKAKTNPAGAKGVINAGRKNNTDRQAIYAKKKAEEDVVNDQGVRAGDSSLEGAFAGRQFYNELHYGSVVGGLAKVISKVSDYSTMSGKGKTLLLGIEHRRLENAAIVSQGMVKLRETFGGSVEDANAAFEILKRAGSSRESIEAAIQGAPARLQQGMTDMTDYIDKLFGFGDSNALMRNGTFMEELRTNLRAVGLFNEADSMPDVLMGADAFEYWRQFSTAEGADIIETMNKFYTAQQLSMIPPSMADSLARHFSHTAEGLTYEQALKQGWKPLNEAGTLGQYTVYGSKPALFPPEVLPKVQEMERYINFDKRFPGGVEEFVKRVDGITSVLKSSLTLWRPGHHMVSTLGNAFMNVLAGTTVGDHVVAAKIMKLRGDLIDLDDAALGQLVRDNTPMGMTLKDPSMNTSAVRLYENGVMKDVSVSLEDLLRGADTIGGVPISPRRVRDVSTTERLDATNPTAKWQDSPIPKGIKAVDHQLARIAAARDNVFRYALFVRELKRGTGRPGTIEEAVLAAAQKVHEFHPTVGTLTAFERKYARRAFYFYTWQKQAFFKILEMAVNKPPLIAWPSKMQFAVATAQGLDPESFGDPYSATGLWAAYNENSVYGPQFDDDLWGAFGVKPALPQLDVIDTYLSPIAFKPEDGLWGNIGSMGDASVRSFLTNSAAPVFTIPATYLTQTTAGSLNVDISNKPPAEFLLDQTGLGTLSRVFDWTPWGQRSDTKLDPYSELNRQRQFLNWLTGLKFTYYENPSALATARQENIDYWQKTLKVGKFAPRPSIYDLGE